VITAWSTAVARTKPASRKNGSPHTRYWKKKPLPNASTISHSSVAAIRASGRRRHA
jgi:hypothetical protein